MRLEVTNVTIGNKVYPATDANVVEITAIAPYTQAGCDALLQQVRPVSLPGRQHYPERGYVALETVYSACCPCFIMERVRR